MHTPIIRLPAALLALGALCLSRPANAGFGDDLRLLYRCSGGDWMEMRVGALDCTGQFPVIVPAPPSFSQCFGPEGFGPVYYYLDLRDYAWRQAQTATVEWGVRVLSPEGSYAVPLDESGCRHLWERADPGARGRWAEDRVAQCVAGETAWTLWITQILGSHAGDAYANLILHLASAPGFGWPDAAPPPVAPQPAR